MPAELLLDTTTPDVRIGIWNGATLMRERSWRSDRNLAETLMAEITGMVADAGMAMHDLSSVRVATGPGGFTTLRIGVVTANSIAYALGIPTIGVTGEIGAAWPTALVEQAAAASSAPLVPFYGSEPHITPRKRGSHEG